MPRQRLIVIGQHEIPLLGKPWTTRNLPFVIILCSKASSLASLALYASAWQLHHSRGLISTSLLARIFEAGALQIHELHHLRFEHLKYPALLVILDPCSPRLFFSKTFVWAYSTRLARSESRVAEILFNHSKRRLPLLSSPLYFLSLFNAAIRRKHHPHIQEPIPTATLPAPGSLAALAAHPD